MDMAESLVINIHFNLPSIVQGLIITNNIGVPQVATELGDCGVEGRL